MSGVVHNVHKLPLNIMLHLFEDSHFLNMALECLIIFELSSTQESKVQYPQNDFYTCQGDIMDEFPLDALILA